MLSMDQNGFAQGRISELSINEVDEVDGAALGLAILAVVAIGGAIVGLVAIGYERAHQNAERAE